MHIFGVTLIGANAANGRKLLLTLALLAGVFLFRYGVMALVRVVTGKSPNERVVFWTRQAVNIVAAVLVFMVVASIWFDNPSRLAGVMGLLAAGIAVALQRVITALAGYIVIMRGKTFSVGDRITMGGVRGDVIALGFIQTTILEMGQPASVSEQTPPAMWVHGRQATGRLVHVSNSQVFEEPIYNYTHELPYLFEEMMIPISFDADADRAEQILVAAAHHHTDAIRREFDEKRKELERRFFVNFGDTEPRVFWRITDNWLELNLRFVVRAHGVREVKDAMYREILREFKAAGLGIASATYDVVGLPPIRLSNEVVERLLRRSDDHERHAADDTNGARTSEHH